MTTPVDRLLDRLDGVRHTGSGRWMARCPSHEDRSPSLSIREGDDGRVLLYDFGGCPTVDVVASLGFDLADLFPENLNKWPPEIRRSRRSHPRIPAQDAIELMDEAALTVEIAARDMTEGKQVDVDEVAQAASRISAIRSMWKKQP